ncbi:YpjP family protein [Jeotgalibacillus sp. R-1-5s-1]|uniref:YpjP family protein n=1 Tax=Jeotgalibacillus sp. R-1-5s-1 TaxID=2555897 RepID=UPI00106BD510|nr:YpjP family protein [Jeotgalibacillus sp. R-1-5s-1]TFE03270.1 hypothetical protein E2491_00340 [Jeotgalibacillus sp. R-1-5s-1]
MPNWLKKSFVVFISIITFGMVSPQDLFANETGDSQQGTSISENDKQTGSDLPLLDKETSAELLISQAREITTAKLGERIMPRIESDIQSEVLPKMEEMITELIYTYSDDEYSELMISPAIGKGEGERIFHIIDAKTNDDVLCFHVRKDRPPLEGYTFNFHYHTAEDGFETHHEIADVYWGKDTPAKFGSTSSNLH